VRQLWRIRALPSPTYRWYKVESLDIEQFRLSNGADDTALLPTRDPVRPQRQKRDWFVSGPIPWTWLRGAGALPGQALAIGMCLWFRSGLEKSRTVRLGRKWPAEMGVQRDAARRALRQLEDAGLVTVERKRGIAPLVTIIKD